MQSTAQLPRHRSEKQFRSVSHEQRDERVRAALSAPVPVDLGIERDAWGKYVGRVAMVARLEDPQAAVLQPDLHFSGEDENPLRLRRAVKLAAKANGTLPQLIAGRRQ